MILAPTETKPDSRVMKALSCGGLFSFFHVVFAGIYGCNVQVEGRS